jgi:hypothetical protein
MEVLDLEVDIAVEGHKSSEGDGRTAADVERELEEMKRELEELRTREEEDR